MSGPKENLAKGWKAIRSGIDTDEPGPVGKYLGCKHTVTEKTIYAGDDLLRQYGLNGSPPKVKAPKAKKSAEGDATGTPEPEGEPAAQGNPVKDPNKGKTRAGLLNGAEDKHPKGKPIKVKAIEYDMSDFFELCIDRYCDLAHWKREKRRVVNTPFLDETKED